MWLNGINIDEGLEHENLTIVTKKYPSKYRKQEISDEEKNNQFEYL